MDIKTRVREYKSPFDKTTYIVEIKPDNYPDELQHWHSLCVCTDNDIAEMFKVYVEASIKEGLIEFED